MAIKLIGLDVDGVMTDGSIVMSNQGEYFKTYHVQDGFGIKQLMQAGITVAIITGRYSQANVFRAEELGISEIHQNIANKIECLHKICKKHSVSLSECVFVGDDIPDLDCIQQVGVGIAVANAVLPVKRSADWITTATGGCGAVREVCDWILSNNNAE